VSSSQVYHSLEVMNISYFLKIVGTQASYIKEANMKVTELAKAFGVKKYTIRYCNRIGLLHP
jgi:hypothetical protein